MQKLKIKITVRANTYFAEKFNILYLSVRKKPQTMYFLSIWKEDVSVSTSSFSLCCLTVGDCFIFIFMITASSNEVFLQLAIFGSIPKSLLLLANIQLITNKWYHKK